MRSFAPPSWSSGESDLAEVSFDSASRDDIPPLLRGLHYLYMTPSLRESIFQILDEMLPEEIDRTTGRPGMALWRILVMGVLRLNLNGDYDRLGEMVNEHRTIRQLLGHGLVDDRKRYSVQSLKDHVSWLTPEIVDQINQVVVQAGHRLVKKEKSAQETGPKTEPKESLKGRCDSFVARAEETLSLLAVHETAPTDRIEIACFVAHAHRQINQIQRRVIQGERIDHAEKVFSLFEPHTEWIRKGKAGVPVELGLNTCIMEDPYGYILHHQVMQGETDEAVAVERVEETQARFSNLKSCSFDGGFYTPANQKKRRARLDLSVLPKKGRRTDEERAFESSDVFGAARCQHAAVESAINALEIHGLDRWPDQGIDGFKR